MTGPGGHNPGNQNPGNQNWNWHPEGLPEHLRPPMPASGGSPSPTAPVDVETSRHLWLATIVLGFVSVVLGVWAMYSNRSEFVDTLVTELKSQTQGQDQSAITADSVSGILVAALVVSVVLGAALSFLVWWIVSKMRGGALWARVVLTIIGVFTVLTALPTVFGVGSAVGGTVLFGSIAAIVQGVTAAGATYLMYRPDSTAYFVPGSGPRKPR